jgi:hypothetical protein
MHILSDLVPVPQCKCILFCQVYAITVGDIKTSNHYTLIGLLVNTFKHITRFGRKGHQVSVERILKRKLSVYEQDNFIKSEMPFFYNS